MIDMLSEDMYQENILEHFRNPHNYGSLPGYSAADREVNPLCGDIIEMQVIIEKDRIREIKFSGKGCAISQAAASMLTDEVRGKTVAEAMMMEKQDITKMLGVEISVARQKCAFLGLKVLKICLSKAQ